MKTFAYLLSTLIIGAAITWAWADSSAAGVNDAAWEARYPGAGR